MERIIDLESNEVHFPDHQNARTARTALNLARTAFTISNTVMMLYMVIIQYILLRIRFAKSNLRTPTSGEILAAVIILWTVHLLLDISLSTFMNAAVQVLWSEETKSHYQRLTYDPGFDVGRWIHVPVERTWWSNVHLIFCEVLVTWILHLSTSLSIFLIPIALEIRQNSRRVFERLRRRCNELVIFMRILFQEEDPIIRFLFTRSFVERKEKLVKKSGQAIQLQRHQDEFPVDGQRTLSWDLSVDKEALEEMMETLGPPGGFGELGFNITAGKVCFGAMGVGTRFNLNFVLEEDCMEDGKDRAKEK
jgi:hypothetical protein